MDTIIINTTHRFPLWMRIKILLGKDLHCSTQIDVEHDDAKVIGNARTTGRVNSLITKRNKPMTDSNEV
jgi:hypothetical protein